MPYEFCFWVSHRLHDTDFFYETLHDDCRYSKGNYLSFSGIVAIVSQDVRRQAAVTIRSVHTLRYGFLLSD
jgi:hypothetical protein